MRCKVGIVDDHQLFLKSLSFLIDQFPSFETSMEALNGNALLQKLAQEKDLPEILLIDVNMPVMDGTQTATQVASLYPGIKTVALSMKDDDLSVIGMLQGGCCAYLLKDIHPNELERALEEVRELGYYNADTSNINYRRLIRKANEKDTMKLSQREIEFLKLACSDKTYKHIAAEMKLSERTIDGYREAIFEKFRVQSRVGMVLEALRRNYVSLT